MKNLWNFLPIVRSLSKRIEALEVELEHEVSSRHIAQDEEEELRRQIKDANGETIKLHEKLLEQQQKFTDWMAQTQGRPAIFGNDFKIDREPIKPGLRKPQGRDWVAEHEAKNREEMIALVAQAEKEIGLAS